MLASVFMVWNGILWFKNRNPSRGGGYKDSISLGDLAKGFLSATGLRKSQHQDDLLVLCPCCCVCYDQGAWDVGVDAVLSQHIDCDIWATPLTWHTDSANIQILDYNETLMRAATLTSPPVSQHLHAPPLHPISSHLILARYKWCESHILEDQHL